MMRRPLRFLLLLALSLVGTTYVVFLVSAIWVMAENIKRHASRRATLRCSGFPARHYGSIWFPAWALFCRGCATRFSRGSLCRLNRSN